MGAEDPTEVGRHSQECNCVLPRSEAKRAAGMHEPVCSAVPVA